MRYIPAILILIVAVAAMWYFMFRETEAERLQKACADEMMNKPANQWVSCDKERELKVK